jgi:hypothetical protein
MIKNQNKLKVFQAIQEGIIEIKEAKKNGVELQTLSEFLNESNNLKHSEKSKN